MGEGREGGQGVAPQRMACHLKAEARGDFASGYRILLRAGGVFRNENLKEETIRLSKVKTRRGKESEI